MASSEWKECSVRRPVWSCASASNRQRWMPIGNSISAMISIEEALGRILSYVDVLPAEQQPLVDALGQVLAADVSSSFDIPPLDNTAMDGYAVRAEDTAGATEDPVQLRVIGELAAGYTFDRTVEPG